jgi:hypothetical protein
VLVEREKTVLPALQIYAEYRRTMERLRAEQADLFGKLGNDYVEGDTLAYKYRSMKNQVFVMNYKIDKERKEIRRLKAVTDPVELPSVPVYLKRARDTRDELKNMVEGLQVKIDAIEPEYLTLKEQFDKVRDELRRVVNLYGDKEGGAPRREFIMRCPAEDCRGFLSTAYKCGTCEAWACVECHVSMGKEKDAAHTCNPEMVLSAKAIKDETRPCPKCGTRIFKTDGCDQMWCIMEGCGTAFSWTSGHIVTGVIHNPHYYEWLRRKEGGSIPREAGDIPCGGMPNTWQMVGAIRPLEMDKEVETILLESFRNLQELADIRLREFPSRLPQLANKEDDVDYLLNAISEDVWQVRLERTETKFNRRKEIGQILQTLATAGADMMNRIYEMARQVDDTLQEQVEQFVEWLLSTAIPELEQLRTFGNESLKILGRRDKTAVPQFDVHWVWRGLRALYSKKAVALAPTPETEIVEMHMEES